ncbi:MAG TPA: type II toxin-antitoxin system Phd/YefM family antitoxin [Planctomycetota bacterium]|nr:type II toxin-antitoxin system Phd/YefM family antitoxin [Planctomycetota bacterium]
MACIPAMNQVDRFVPVSKAKNQLLHLVRELAERDEVLALTRQGVPSAVILSPGRFQGILETIEVLSDARAIRSLRRSLRQARRVRWAGEATVFGRREARG